jgi:DNA-directed RNA polymerase subunit RPC12/RpoP
MAVSGVSEPAGRPSGGVTFACGQCGATLSFDGVRSQRCPYCDSPNFVERPPTTGLPDPQFVVTFIGDAAVARRALDRWLGSRTMFADSALRSAKVEDLRGVYVPAYLYSAVARTEYTAQIGENYQETETYTTTDSEGKTTTQSRTVTRTEYRALAGEHIGYVSDVIVTASRGLGNAELQRIEPFDLKQMRRFSPPLISGWITEEFSRTDDECMKLSRGEAVDQVGAKLGRFMPGDSYSDLTYKTRVSWESLDPILVPVWVFAVRYREDKDPLRILINGQTGEIAGKVPLSPFKIVLAILAGLALIAGALLLFHYLGEHHHR